MSASTYSRTIVMPSARAAASSGRLSSASAPFPVSEPDFTRGGMTMRIVPLLLSLVMLAAMAMPSMAEKRVALVIGNDRYDNLPPDQQLQKAVNDARAVGDAVSQLGFQVIRG